MGIFIYYWIIELFFHLGALLGAGMDYFPGMTRSVPGPFAPLIGGNPNVSEALQKIECFFWLSHPVIIFQHLLDVTAIEGQVRLKLVGQPPG